MKKKDGVLSELFKYAGNYRYLTISSIILSAISSILALVPFVYIWRISKEILDVYPNFQNANGIVHNGWMAVGFSIFSILIYVSSLMCSHIAAFKIASNMRLKAMRHIMKLPLGYFADTGSGKIRKIVEESSKSTETYLAHQLPDYAGTVVTPIAMIILLFIFDWKLGLISMVPIILAFAIMSKMTGQQMVTSMKKYQDALEDMSNEAVEYIRGIPVVKTFGQTIYSFDKFHKSIQNYAKWCTNYTISLRNPMVSFILAINSIFAFLIFTGLWLTNGGVTSTIVINLLFYILFTPIITVTINKVMFSSENTMLAKDSVNRINSILKEKALPDSDSSSQIKNTDIVFKNVSFSYPNSQRKALSNISLNIKGKSKIALVGPSGGGKTTLASLIPRFWDIQTGKISIGGKDIKNISQKELMSNIAFVFQNSKLFKKSIYENVRLAKEDATKEEVLEALSIAQCYELVEKLPNGIDTLIGSKGVYFSGGEVQRIDLARAILKNAPIIILDEATAFADPDNEIYMQKAIKKLTENKTVIMIAHRLTTIQDSDCIYVLKDGQIIEQGKHNELIDENKIYSSMWNEYQKSIGWKV